MIKLDRRKNVYVMGMSEYPRITAVLGESPEIEKWRMRVGDREAERISKEAAEFGDNVHLLTVLHDRKQYRKAELLIGRYPYLHPYYVTWRKWVREYVEEMVLVERVVWSRRLRIAGTLDRTLIVRGDREATIADIKTGGLHEEMGEQLALYHECYKEMKLKPKVRRRIVISMPRNNPGEIRVKDFTNDKYVESALRKVKEYHLIMRGVK